jgi:hypothetical protein
MSSKATTIEILEKVEDYTQGNCRIGKLSVIDISTDVASSLISRLRIILFFAMFILLNLSFVLIGELEFLFIFHNGLLYLTYRFIIFL